jgi:diacylglycerol kinase family enzyme
MRKVAVIINRHAGAGIAQAHLRAARRVLWGWPLEVIEPASLGELALRCRALKPDDYEAIVVIGGDGTFQKVLQARWNSQPRSSIPLLPFPAGTANDLATELGIRPDWEQVQALLDGHSVQDIDLILVNGIPFATLAGVGVGAKLAEEYNQRRQQSWLFRQAARQLQSQIYLALSAKALILGKKHIHHLQIQAPGFCQRLRTNAVFICNQYQLGGQLTVSRTGRNDDGLFQVTIVPRTGLVSLMSGLSDLRSGIIPDDFIQTSVERLWIRDLDQRPIRVFGDGEILVESTELSFTIANRALSVYRERDTAGVAPSLRREIPQVTHS